MKNVPQHITDIMNNVYKVVVTSVHSVSDLTSEFSVPLWLDED